MWGIGQARRRALSASSTGPLGCLSAGIFGVGRLNRMSDTLSPPDAVMREQCQQTENSDDLELDFLGFVRNPLRQRMQA